MSGRFGKIALDEQKRDAAGRFAAVGRAVGNVLSRIADPFGARAEEREFHQRVLRRDHEAVEEHRREHGKPEGVDARGQFSRTTPQSFGRLANQSRREKSDEARGATFQVFRILKSGKRASRPSQEYGAGSRNRFTREEAEKMKKYLEGLNPGMKWEIV